MTDDSEQATTREMVKETRRDVAWICKTLTEIKEDNAARDKRIAEDNALRDGRITNLETVQNRWIGQNGVIAVIISSAVAFFTALASGGWLR